MRRSYGFTLVELLVVMTILGILSAIAVPSLQRFIRSSSMSSAVNTFMADARYARSEAIRRGGGVVLCRSNFPEAAAPVCNTGSGPGGNGWVSGWIVFHDLNRDGDKDANEPVLRVQAAITSVNSIVDAPASTKLNFVGSGRLNLGALASFQFGSTPQFANSEQRVLCVSRGGRVRIAGDGTAGCA
ncbi:GspH/FimT family pseudopilin [uncultured Ramlibacter sp.]|uniref:GspH/FimT family pseudopilin n=1 Tax=uncultured Ramlibacter sp. TaxID=260755 RepID=UPI002601E234|nr:GspH/FimT family pseudopilin [uncultured Ramlibacter sp.]